MNTAAPEVSNEAEVVLVWGRWDHHSGPVYAGCVIDTQTQRTTHLAQTNLTCKHTQGRCTQNALYSVSCSAN